MNNFKNADGKPVLLAMVDTIQNNKVYLSELDGLIGDGDHGVNMNKGFTMYSERLGDDQVSLSEGLDGLGSLLFREIGGSMGPIYGTLFMGMAESIEDLEEIDTAAFADMLEKGLEDLFDVVDARIGDKTLIDTLEPAAKSCRAAVDKPLSEALTDMKTIAKKGCDSTKDLVAKYGRSARLGERSRGVLDAGAVSCFLLLEAMADSIQKTIID